MGEEKKKEIEDYLALHLGFYLASWGMYRGSSFLLQRDYKTHISIVKLILQEKYKDLWDINLDFLNSQSDKISELISELCKKIHVLYREQGRDILDEEEKNEDNSSETLITKILLGTFACVPAFDRFYKTGMKWLKRKLGFPKNAKRLTQNLIRNDKVTNTFYALIEFANHYSDSLSIFSLGKNAQVESYPIMKCLDMFLWQVGYELDLAEQIKKVPEGKKKDVLIARAKTLGYEGQDICSEINERWNNN